MNRWTAGFCCLAAVSSVARATAPVGPDDFAYALPILTPESAAAYRVAIPAQVYAQVVHADLSDVRIFNAAGEVVPYEIQQAPARMAQHHMGPPLPLFPLRADARPALDGVQVTIQSSGTEVNLQAGRTAAKSAAIVSYLVDARQVTLPLYGFRLAWPDDAPDFSGSISVESSDDLKSWQPVASRIPVVNLHGSGAHLVENQVALGGSQARFWRLAWDGDAAPFELTSVSAQTDREQPEPDRLSVAVSGSPVAGKTADYAFDLGAQPPIVRANLLLPQVNSVARAQLLSRARPDDPWRPVVSGDFFRMGEAASERHNAPLDVARNTDRFWLARLDQPSAGGAPRLQVGWDAQDIVFLARGAGPYRFAYGSGTAPAAASALSAMLAGAHVTRATTGTAVTLGGTQRLLPPPRTVPWKMAILWTVLGMGVLLLAVMAYRLSRELAKQPAQPD